MNFNYQGVQGFDVSFYQDDNQTIQKIDFSRMKAWGSDFVIVRAGQNLWLDEDFRDNWQAAGDAGLPRAAYWFYDPRASPERQAAFFSGLFANDKPEGRLWVDLEFPAKWGGAYTDWWNWRTFLEETKKLSGCRVGVYTANWWWQPNAVEKGADLAYFSQYPLWVAQYTDSPANVILPKGWSKAMIWQNGTPTIGWQVGVESEEVDHNYWNSDFSFEDEFGGSHPEPPSGGSMAEYKVIWSNGVARRTAPTVFNSYTGKSYGYNEIVKVVEENIADKDDPTNADKKWVKFEDGLYGACDYPDSAGVPRQRMQRIEPEPQPAPPTIAKAVLYDDAGSVVAELFPQ